MVPRRCEPVETECETMYVVCAQESSRRIEPAFNCMVCETTRIGLRWFWVICVLTSVFPSLTRAATQLSQRAMLVATSDASTTSLPEIFGRVVDPNRRPAAGARVGLITAELGLLELRNAILEPEWVNDTAKPQFVMTDAEGRFRFGGKWSHPYYLFATHAAGFAPVSGKDFQTDREIRLERWGRIEGQLGKGHMGTDRRVWMRGLLGPASAGSQCGVVYDAPCNADGRFVFERVPAGWFNVGYLIPLGDGIEALTARTAVVIKAGETARVQIGGGGRSVIGRFVLPASFGRPARFGTGFCTLRRCEKIEREKVLQLSEEQLENDPYASDARVYDPRTDDFVTSVKENGREWLDSPWQVMDDHAELMGDGIWNDMDWRGYAFRVGPDGSFRVEDVVPGRYELSVSLAERRPGESFLSPFAQYRGMVQVSSGSQSHADQSFDVGTLTLNVFGVGEPAPQLGAETFDGEPVRLSDYRGKFILLSISSSANRDLRKHLEELSRTYASRDDFQIIAVDYDLSEEQRNTLAAQGRIKPVYTSDESGDDRLAKQYHLFGSPDMVLIDPQGRIAATHLWGPDGGARLMRTVQNAIERR